MEKNIYICVCTCIIGSLCYIAEIKHSIVNQLYFNKLKKKILLEIPRQGYKPCCYVCYILIPITVLLL